MRSSVPRTRAATSSASRRSRSVAMPAEQLDTGMVFNNGFGLAVPDLPFGGVKHSGLAAKMEVSACMTSSLSGAFR